MLFYHEPYQFINLPVIFMLTTAETANHDKNILSLNKDNFISPYCTL